MKPKKKESGLVAARQETAPGFCVLTFKAPSLAEQASPGQFVMVYMPSEQQHLLPRPFSVFRADPEKGELALLFELKGRGTGLMARAELGSAWKLSGPLGQGFPAVPENALLVAGGVGIAPLAFLAASTEKPRTLIYGARTADHFACPPAALDLPNLTVIEVTDDGSRGHRGSVVDLLPGLLPGAAALFACGPHPMLAAVSALCAQKDVPAWVSLEEKMACGIGACLGCAVQAAGGYRRVCHEGPVFPAGEVCFNA